MIVHLTEPHRWEQSLREGVHTGSTRGVELAEQGFIHCSDPDQVDGVVQRFYADCDELLELHIDPARLEVRVVWERLPGVPEHFPHVYGPIPLAAVRNVVRRDRQSQQGTHGAHH